MTAPSDIPRLLDELEARHDRSCTRLRAALGAYMDGGIRPDPQARAKGLFAYPELRMTYAPEGPRPRVGRAYGRVGAGPMRSRSPGRGCSGPICANS